MPDPIFNNAVANPFGMDDPIYVDIDGDSDLDAFIGDKFYKNTGSKTEPIFAAPISKAFGLGLPHMSLGGGSAFSDIDGDGDLDAFTGTYEGQVLFYRNTGTFSKPSFAAALENPFGLSGTSASSAPTFVDIDGDGDLDMFSGSGYQGTHFFKNTGTATNPVFAKPVIDPFGITSSRGYSTPTFVDIDGDGDLDLFIQNDHYLFSGTSFFRNIGTDSNPFFYQDTPTRFGIPGDNYVNLTFADIDGDDDMDAFIGSQFYQNSDTAVNLPDFSTYVSDFGINDETLTWSPAPAFVDIDGDGDMDAFIGLGYDGNDPNSPDAATGNVLFYKNIGTKNQASFAPAVKNPFGLKDVGKDAMPTFVDIDGDHDMDAFISNAAGNTLFFKNTGTITNPTFAAPTTNPFGLVKVSGGSDAKFVDIDGDGDSDAFIGNLYFKNIGTQTNPKFSAPLTNPFGLGLSPDFLDIDRDGDFDAISGNTLFLNQGNAANPVFPVDGVDLYGLPQGGYRISVTSRSFVDIDGDGDFDTYTTSIYEYGGIYLFGNFFFNNKAPNVTNLATPEQYTKGTPLNLQNIIVEDSDNDNIAVTLKLSNAAVGKLSTATSGTVTSTFNATTGTWTASGKLANVNTLLANLQFIPANNGTDNFTVVATVSDNQAAPLVATKSFKIPGSSLLKATAGNDILIGTTGDDTVTYASATGPVTVSLNITTAQNTVNSGMDQLIGIDNLIGSKFNDKLTGDSDDNVIQGGAGNDTIRGWSGADAMLGGIGNDTYYVENAGDVVTEKFNAGTDLVSSNLSYTLGLHLENLTLTGPNAIDGVGNGLNNKLIGNAANNFLSGDAGSDILSAGSGDDYLNGGSGKDTLTGGAGKDTFFIGSKDAFDTITDFNVTGGDIIELDDDVFTSLGWGDLANEQFRVGSKALDSDDFIIYNKTTGAIFYDADGSGAGAALQIAKVGIGLALTNTDFVVY